MHNYSFLNIFCATRKKSPRTSVMMMMMMMRITTIIKTYPVSSVKGSSPVQPGRVVTILEVFELAEAAATKKTSRRSRHKPIQEQQHGLSLICRILRGLCLAAFGTILSKTKTSKKWSLCFGYLQQQRDSRQKFFFYVTLNISFNVICKSQNKNQT